MLKTATVVDDSSKSDEVGMDDIVEVEFEEMEKWKSINLSHPSVEIPWKTVVFESPIGKALKSFSR